MSAANLRQKRRKKLLKHPNCIPYLMKQNIFGLVFLLKKKYTHMFKHGTDMLPKSV